MYEDITNIQNNKPLSHERYENFVEESISSISGPDEKYLLKLQSKTFQEI